MEAPPKGPISIQQSDSNPNSENSPRNYLALSEEIRRVQKLIKFRSLVVERRKNLRARGTTHIDQRKALRKAGRWFTATFYDNVALGNIVNFEIRVFVNDTLPQGEIDQLLKDAENSLKRRSSGSGSDKSPRGSPTTGNVPARVNHGEVTENSTSPPRLSFMTRRFLGEAVRTRSLTGEKIFEFGRANFRMNNHMEQLLRDKYTGPASQIMEHLFVIGFRYSALEFDNHHLSIPPKVVELFQFELFGSPFNTVRPYFGPFPDIEIMFGSRGTFFTTPFPAEFSSFTFNPPYAEDFLERAVTRLIEQMKLKEAAKQSCFVLCVLPLWDPFVRKKSGAPICTAELRTTDDPNKARKFEAYDKLQNSGFMVEEIILKRDRDRPFFSDHARQNHNLLLCDIHLVSLAVGSYRIPMARIAAAWK
jgi:hypothetical protein